MLRFVSFDIVFQEVPSEITLAINISGCPNRCQGCHSVHLREDIGEPLDVQSLSSMLDIYGDSVTCVCFMGGDAEPHTVQHLARYVRSYCCAAHLSSKENSCSGSGPETNRINILSDIASAENGVSVSVPVTRKAGEFCSGGGYALKQLKTAWYSGRPELPEGLEISDFDFIKLGEYIPVRGGLASALTNQKFYKIVKGEMIDITYKLRKL